MGKKISSEKYKLVLAGAQEKICRALRERERERELCLNFESLCSQESIRSENPPLEPEEEEWENRSGHRLTWKRYHRYKGEVSQCIFIPRYVYLVSRYFQKSTT